MARANPSNITRSTLAERIPVGISSCLMGQPVRFNGSHKRSRFCTDTLSHYFDFVSLCPEVAIGLGTPREPIRLASDKPDGEVRAIGTVDRTIDVTDALAGYARQQASEQSHLCGYIFMQKSPSCGLFGVKRYLANGHPEGTAPGIYADTFRQANPLLPMEEAGRLNDAGLLENFMTRVFAYHDWQQFRTQAVTANRLVAFHSRYKYLVMAHDLVAYKNLGRILADLSSDHLNSIADEYFAGLMQALAHPASRKMHTNTLMHLQGYLKNLISDVDKKELTEVIHQYREGVIPLVVPLTLLKHHFNHYPDASAYARQQVYLNPHPYELGLRNSL